MDSIIREYYQRNVGLYDLFPIVTTFPEAIKVLTESKHIELLKNYGEGKRNADGKITYTVPLEIRGIHSAFLDKQKSYTLAEGMLPQSMIVILVSQFDIFVSRAIRYIYYKRPELLNAIQRNVTYAQINTLGDIDRIKEFLIEEEIESVLRDSHHAQIGWFEKKLNTTLQADKELISSFVEITQRRNLFVHCDGIVSQQYISVCKEHGNNCENIKAGQRLTVDKEYFFNAADRLMEIGCKLGQIIWRKIDVEERMKANESLTQIAYDLVNGGRYKAAILILEFFINNREKLIHDDAREYTAIINAAQAYKWLGNEARSEELLNMENWHSKSDNFLLASLVLRNRYSEAAEVMERIGSERYGISKGAYIDWPIFREFRKSAEFLEAFKKIYGEDFVARRIQWSFDASSKSD